MYYETKISAPTRGRQHFDARIELKSLDSEGRFAGYASVFNIVDNQHDVIMRGAFAKTLARGIDNVKLLWQHQQGEPIGILERLFEDSRGLYVEGRLLLNVRRAQEAYTLLKAGAMNGLSIGYSPVRYRIDAETGVRQLLEVDLWEISLVTFPANAAANVTVVKQATPILTNHEMEKWDQAQKAGHVLALSNALDQAMTVLQ